MPCPYFDVVWQTQKFAPRTIQIIGATTWEIAARGAYVHVEEGITAEDVI